MIIDVALQILESQADGVFSMDLGITSNDLVTEDTLRTAVLISIFSDARVSLEEMPDGEPTRRGFWGDALEENDTFGSKLWLLAREKKTEDVLDRAREYVTEALSWMVDDGIARELQIDTAWTPEGFLGISGKVYRPNAETFQFDTAWNAELGVA